MALRFCCREYAQTMQTCSTLILRRTLFRRVAKDASEIPDTRSSKPQRRVSIDEEENIPLDEDGRPIRYIAYKDSKGQIIRTRWNYNFEDNAAKKKRTAFQIATPILGVVLVLGVFGFILIKKQLIEDRQREMFERMKAKRSQKLAEQEAEKTESTV